MDSIQISKTVRFGKRKGEKWGKANLCFVKWVAYNFDDFNGEDARAELERRGVAMAHKFHITAHAINRASNRIPKIVWGGEGIYTWLARMTHEAIKKLKSGEDRVKMEKGTFVFNLNAYQPILITVI